MTRPTTRSVARMAADARNPDGAEGEAAAAPVAPDHAEGSNGPDNAGEASRDPAAAGGSRSPEAAEGSRSPGAAEASRDPCPDEVAAQLAIVPYAEDIDRHLGALEADPARRPTINYYQEIQGGMMNMNTRGILVDWMAQVAYEFNLLDETLHHAVSYVDRYLSKNAFSRDRLRLLGTTALFVASKYEEIYPPQPRNFSAITVNTYGTQQVVNMEAHILRNLNFDVGTPTVITFLRKFLTSCCEGNESVNERLELMCRYLAELGLLDDYYIRFLPSVVAAACLFVAKFTINPKTRPWNLAVQRNTGYKVSDMKDCICAIYDLQAGKKLSNLTAVRNKYKHNEFGSVSRVTLPKKITASFLRDLKYANS